MEEGDWEIEVDVAESDIVEVKEGQEVQLTFDALDSDEIFYGRVERIDPASTVIQDVVYYKVEISLEEVDSRFKRGMSIGIGSKRSVAIIPNRLVRQKSLF